jgi:hypothetical protein
VELQLPIIAEVPDGYAESTSPTASQYAEPSAINNYYDTEGPPVVTYYPPPPDYYYLYAWIPSPFWCSGFFFPGFFVLHDFHRVTFMHRHACVITNHIRDHRTGRIFAVDPARRHGGGIWGGKDTPRGTGFNSTEARKGAQSIFERSRDRVALNRPSMPITGRGLHDRNSAYSRSDRSTERQVYSRGSRPSGFNGRNGDQRRSPAIDRRMNGLNGMNFQRPSTGETRSFSPPPRGGGQHFGSSGVGSRGFSEPRQGGERGSSFGRGGSRF